MTTLVGGVGSERPGGVPMYLHSDQGYVADGAARAEDPGLPAGAL
jgi:hypothetical protein